MNHDDDLKAWARDFMTAVDAKDLVRIDAALAEDIHFIFANQPMVTGRARVLALFEASKARFTTSWHEIIEISRDSTIHPRTYSDIIFVEAIANYVTKSWNTVRVPVISVLYMNNSKIESYKVFMDPTPVFGES